MTCCYVLLDTHHQSLTYTNAGHFYLYLFKKRTNNLEKLESTDSLLGMFELEEISFSKQQRSWERGDILLLYSDGITEARNSEGKMFENSRLEEIIVANPGVTPAELEGLILRTLSEYCGGAEQDDDITLVVAKAM